MILPFRDHNPSRKTPYVTWALIAINIVVFLFTFGVEDPRPIYAEYALVPAWVEEGHQLTGYLTSMFLHGGFQHILGNMLFLWIFGDNVEDRLGHLYFLGFYLLSGLAASWLHVQFNEDSLVPLIGASGAIAGVMGGYLLLYPFAKVDVFLFIVIIFRTFAVPAFVVLAIWFILQTVQGFAVLDGQGGGVAYLAHFGGFVAGFVMILPFWLRLGGVEFWRKSHYHPPHPATKLGTVSGIPRITRR